MTSLIPSELKERKQWVTWKLEGEGIFGVKPKKVPYTKGFKNRASTTDPASWCTFEEALQSCGGKPTPQRGIGYVFIGDYIGIDLDAGKGKITDRQKYIARHIESYTETSPSGRGLHIIVKGSLKGRSGLNSSEVEIYNKGRYFTFTGQAHPTRRTITSCETKVHQLYDALRKSQGSNGGAVVSATSVQSVPIGSRSTFLAQRIGALRRAGLPDATLMVTLQELNETHCNPPLPEAELQATLLKSAMKWRGETDKFQYTDDGNARRMHYQYNPVLKFCKQWKSWLYWDGIKWATDVDFVERTLLGEVLRDMYSEASRAAMEDDAEKQKKILKWLRSCDNQHRRMQALRAAEQYFTVKAEVFDNRPDILNVGNGSLELETGKMRPGDKEDLLTWNLETEFDPDAECPIWDRFLLKILPDPDVRAFVQRAVGYSLTGSSEEQCLFFLYGDGANGKSTFVETLLALLGPYAQKVSHNVLFSRRSDGATPEVAGLKGKRVAIVQEVEMGKRLSAARTKDLTGSDTITARQLYKDPIEFVPTHKIWICGNHKPTIAETDHGTWRRIKLIPFEVQIPSPEQDRRLLEKLKTELPGILAWAFRGSQAWLGGGLQVPAVVSDATKLYQNEEDIFANFARECLEIIEDGKVHVKEMGEIWREWCPSHREVPKDWGLKELTKGLKRLGLNTKQIKLRGHRFQYWMGVRPKGTWNRGAGLEEDGAVRLNLGA